MKIAVKKKYLVGISSYVSIVLGLVFLQRLWLNISRMSFSDIVLPIIFIITTLHAIIYWLNLRQEEKTINDVSREVAKNNPDIAESIKIHLWQKCNNESYTLNVIRSKIRLTSSWAEQDKIEKNESNKNIPKIIKKEFVKRI